MLIYANYCLSQAFSHAALGQAFSHSALGHTFSHESAFSQVAQSFWHESAFSQATLQQESAATHSVLALSQVLALLLQHELIVRAAAATRTNNTFFIFFFVFCLTINSISSAKLQSFLDTLWQNAVFLSKNM